jgi:3-hydroxybutyryl-CoA dehydrogenase
MLSPFSKSCGASDTVQGGDSLKKAPPESIASPGVDWRDAFAPLPEPNASTRVAIIGGGLMGHALAAVFLAAGAPVSVFEADPAARNSLPSRIAATLTEWKGSAAALERLRVLPSLAELDPDTHFALEAIPEDLPLKQKLFAELEGFLPNAILATNSSVYPVGSVAGSMRDPTRAIGTHWWNPPHLIPIVEVIQGSATRPEIVDWTLRFLAFCGKIPVHVRKDTPGFIGNRLQHALWREALALVEEGVADAETVDLVVRNTLGMKLRVLGPLENADYVGLDMTLAIHNCVFPVLSRAQQPSRLLTESIQAGKLGAKSGSGLMDWPQGRKTRLAERLAKHVRRQAAEGDA